MVHHALPDAASVADLLTVILTTSPIPTVPSTDLVGQVLASFEAHCPDLLDCAVVVVFDTYDHVGPQLRLKKGTVTANEAEHYGAYKKNVQRLVLDVWGRRAGLAGDETAGLVPSHVEEGAAEYGSPFLLQNSVAFLANTFRHDRLPPITFVEPAARLGFGLGVRTALRAATTPYVWVQQHDWSLVADIPVAAMLRTMRASEQRQVFSTRETPTPPADLGPVPVRYVCLPSVRMLRYATSAHVAEFPVLKATTAAHTRTDEAGADAVPLTPLFFWHDKTHVARCDHYLARIFSSRLALARGDFIEDRVGQLVRTQMKADAVAWARWGTWQYAPGGGATLCLRHLQGRTWRGAEREQEMRAVYQARNKAEADELAREAAADAAQKEQVAASRSEEGADTTHTTDAWDFMPLSDDEE